MTRTVQLSGLPPHVSETVVTVGTFDGVHRGHVDVLTRLAARGHETGRASVLVTFDSHPLELLKPEAAPSLLTSLDEKLVNVAGTGVDYVAVLPFTRELANHSAEQFVDLILRAKFGMADLLIGYDHGFGRGRAGDVDTLRELGAARGFSVDVVAPVHTSDGNPVSSTRIRSSLREGDLDGAAAALGRRYSVSGRVVAGEARGRALGYPTINVAPASERKLLPPDGVYAVRVHSAKGRFDGMLNLGGRPTFGDERRTIEAHLFDASGDFYGDLVEVGFVARLRDTRRFENIEALMAQLRADDEAARRALTTAAS
jgi:riboflavin kinase/FMN adenylyltransferase